MSALLHIRDVDMVGKDGPVERTDITLQGDRINAIGSGVPSGAVVVVEGEGTTTAYPGLINAHEHLVGTWSPRTGWGPHDNVYSWLDRYMIHGVRQERLRVPEPLIYRLGMYRNLLSGVTTVLDHFTRVDPALFEALPIRVPTEYGREWVMRSHTHPGDYPSWGKGIPEEMAETAGRIPFVIHVSEGTDEECRGELERLEALGGLAPNAILVHGVAFSSGDIARVASSGASVVWCPASNDFLYGRTVDVKALLSAGVRVALGTDSSMTGSPWFFEEMRFAGSLYRRMYGEDLPAREIVKMATENAASAILAGGELGVLAEGALADVLLLEGSGSDPFERLVAAHPRDIDLVLAGGAPVMGSTRHASLFEKSGLPHSRVLVQGVEKLVSGDPDGLVDEIRTHVGSRKRFHFLPLDRA